MPLQQNETRSYTKRGVLNTSIVIYQSISKILWTDRITLTSSAPLDEHLLSKSCNAMTNNAHS